jgi:hypothetical protein
MSRVKLGDKFEYLTVLELISNDKNPLARCECKCGNEIFAQRGSLKSGRTKSCGCKKSAELGQRSKTHGMSRSKTYKIWRNILSRCNNKNVPEYHNYGGRGIKVEWKNFEEFYQDMGERPLNHWIDRLDNNKNYSKNNCKWVLPTQNQKNKRVSKLWIVNGNIYDSCTSAAKELGVHVSVIIRGCNGYTRNGKNYPPRFGWGCEFKYN